MEMSILNSLGRFMIPQIFPERFILTTMGFLM